MAQVGDKDIEALRGQWLLSDSRLEPGSPYSPVWDLGSGGPCLGACEVLWRSI